MKKEVARKKYRQLQSMCPGDCNCKWWKVKNCRYEKSGLGKRSANQFCSWQIIVLKGKCAFGPFLSILVIECQHKCFNVNQCPWMNKVQIYNKGMFLSLSTLVLCTNVLCLSAGNRKNRIGNEMALFSQVCSVWEHRTVSGAPGWLEQSGRSREFTGDVRL